VPPPNHHAFGAPATSASTLLISPQEIEVAEVQELYPRCFGLQPFSHNQPPGFKYMAHREVYNLH
jgi:hypothetical protein